MSKSDQLPRHIVINPGEFSVFIRQYPGAIGLYGPRAIFDGDIHFVKTAFESLGEPTSLHVALFAELERSLRATPIQTPTDD